MKGRRTRRPGHSVSVKRTDGHTDGHTFVAVDGRSESWRAGR
ncbi:hypothetical protein SPURM210S_04102 [Streptomyces purpurascens]